jgi:M6 family metalloprotease-like protein
MSMPFFGKQFTFTQPDGTHLDVRGWGNQHHAVFETLDGYTIVENPATRFYEYATQSSDGKDLRPLGVRVGAIDPRRLGLRSRMRPKVTGNKVSPMVSNGLVRGRSRWEVRRLEAKARLQAMMTMRGVQPAPPQRPTVGDFTGLCLLVQFPDVPGTIKREEVESFCNKKGYKGFGNKGSVYDYFKDVSAGKLRYTNIVAHYYTAQHPRAYYTDETVAQPIRTVELIKEALAWLQAKGFDFSKVTADSGNYVYATNVFYAGPRVNNWAKGLWPHSYHLTNPVTVAPGKTVYDYQITDMGNELTLGTFCHENGHMICDFPDLYDYGYQSNGVGYYCLMCAGGIPNPKNPAHVGAYLKYKAGWSTSMTALTNGLKAKAPVGKNEFFIHKKSEAEYFLVENRKQSKRDASLPDSGLTVWHIDELGDNSDEQMTPAKHYECSLMQADGKNDLEKGINNGDGTDLFRKGGSNKFGITTNPKSQWWDQNASGLEIYNIGPAGANISFTVKL